MKKFEITKEQIIELINCSSQIKVDYRLKEWFPQAFESELEVGKWYKIKDTKLLCFVTDILDTYKVFGYGFGLDSGNWIGLDDVYWNSKGFELATDKEVETALIAEAKRRGFKGENRIKWSFDNVNYSISYPIFSSFEFENNTLFFAKGVVFENGKWAEIISEPIEVTLEQIADKFGINVEQLKIKK